VSLQQWDLTIDDNHLIRWMWVKKIRRKTLAQNVFDRRWSLDGVNTLIKKYQCEIFNFVDLCSGRVGIVWSTTTRTRVCDTTAVTFSVKCFNPLKLSSVKETSSESVLLYTFYLFTSINNNVISSGKSYCSNDTFTDVRFTSLPAKNILKEYNLFYAVRIIISLAILSKNFL